MALGFGNLNRMALSATAALIATIGALIMPVWVGRATHQVQGSRAQAAVAYAHLPLAFEPNVGQANRRATYIASGLGYSLLLTKDSVVLNLARRVRVNRARRRQSKLDHLARIRSTRQGQLPGRQRSLALAHQHSHVRSRALPRRLARHRCSLLWQPGQARVRLRPRARCRSEADRPRDLWNGAASGRPQRRAAADVARRQRPPVGPARLPVQSQHRRPGTSCAATTSA
jgi:hypothetical protein